MQGEYYDAERCQILHNTFLSKLTSHMRIKRLSGVTITTFSCLFPLHFKVFIEVNDYKSNWSKRKCLLLQDRLCTHCVFFGPMLAHAYSHTIDFLITTKNIAIRNNKFWSFVFVFWCFINFPNSPLGLLGGLNSNALQPLNYTHSS